MSDVEPVTRLGRTRDEPDPDLEPVEELSPLEALQRELQADVEAEDLELQVTSRKGIVVTYGTQIRYEELVAWQRRAKDTRMPGGVNPMKMAALVLANRCRRITIDGETVTDAKGGDATLGSDVILDMVKADSAADAVRKFYGRDGLVEAHATKVLIAAGYNDDALEAEPEDPTRS